MEKKMVNIERLEQTIRVLRELTPQGKGFNIMTWGTRTTGGKPNFKPVNLSDSADHCKTVCCAFGHVCLDPWHNNQGLTGDFTLSINNFREDLRVTYKPNETNVSWGCGNMAILEIIESYYSIGREDALELFAGDRYHEDAQPEHVIARIEKLLRRAKKSGENNHIPSEQDA
jgi:hypothetical protein